MVRQSYAPGNPAATDLPPTGKAAARKIGAEENLLACLLRLPWSLRWINAIVSEEHFGEYAHRVLYRAILSLYRQGGEEAVTPDAIAEAMRRDGTLDELGSEGAACLYLARLYDTFGTGHQAFWLARVLRRSADRRSLQRFAHEFVVRAEHPASEPGHLAREAAGELLGLAVAFEEGQP